MKSSYSPSYTDDITVAGVLLADRIQTLYASLRGKGAIQLMDIELHPNLRLKVEKVQLVDRFGAQPPFTGTLYITATHVIFVGDEPGKEIWVLHSHIGSVERGSLSAAGCPLTIRCKTFRTLSFIIPRDKECQDVFETLTQLSRPTNIEEVYAFSYIPSFKDLDKGDGWKSVDVMEDYKRLGIPNDQWVVTDFNSNYQHCETYPSQLIVPKSAPKQVLIGSSKFRSRGRLPALSYYCPATKAVICRCSQPLSGFSARCMEDEEMMQHIMKTNSNCNVLYVCDTRPRINAMANKASGKGFEDEKNYANIRFHFFAIENIHVMRASLAKLLEVCHQKSTTSAYLSGLESSGWLKHVRAILEAGMFMADSVWRGVSCVVHCSDGWDRTSQTISIASILLDPHYRTLHGFKTLIEKDWLAFGHKFADRSGHTGHASGETTSEAGAKEVSPVFTQFLDCVYQLTRQYPRGFEFNERFLTDLHDHVHSCQFGTFLGNCDKDRQDLRLGERTYSLWGYMEKVKTDYLNPMYLADQNPNRIWRPDVRPQAIRLWRELYNRFDNGIHARESVGEVASSIKDHIAVLEDHLSLLQKRVGELRLALGKSPKSPMIDSGHSSGGPSVFADAHGGNGPLHAATLAEKTAQMKLLSDSESGVEDPPSTPSNDSSKRVVHSKLPHKGATNPSLSQLVSAGMSQSLASLDLSFTDVCSSELSSVAVRWQSLRAARDCNGCNSRFAQFDRKLHCYKCGAIFCRRCLDNYTHLPGVFSQAQSPVCKPCSQDLQKLASPT